MLDYFDCGKGRSTGKEKKWPSVWIPELLNDVQFGNHRGGEYGVNERETEVSGPMFHGVMGLVTERTQFFQIIDLSCGGVPSVVYQRPRILNAFVEWSSVSSNQEYLWVLLEN